MKIPKALFLCYIEKKLNLSRLNLKFWKDQTWKFNFLQDKFILGSYRRENLRIYFRPRNCVCTLGKWCCYVTDRRQSSHFHILIGNYVSRDLFLSNRFSEAEMSHPNNAIFHWQTLKTTWSAEGTANSRWLSKQCTFSMGRNV